MLSLILMITLDLETWLRFGIWMIVGFFVYGLYSRRRSRFVVEA